MNQPQDSNKNALQHIKAGKFILPVAFIAAALVLIGSIAAPGLRAQDNSGAATMDEQALHEVIRSYILDNPDVIIEALESYQNRQRDAEQAGFTEALVNNREALERGPYAGNADGDILVVEFFDYNCGYCKRALPDVENVLENHPDVKFVFKELPILNASSRDAARWALAAGKQGQYWEFHSALMNHGGTKSVAALEMIAENLGLDVAQMRADAGSTAVREELEENIRLSRELGIRGTPAFVIGDVLAPGYMGYENMNEVINQVRSAQN